jgi:hypothetical protein
VNPGQSAEQYPVDYTHNLTPSRLNDYDRARALLREAVILENESLYYARKAGDSAMDIGDEDAVTGYVLEFQNRTVIAHAYYDMAAFMMPPRHAFLTGQDSQGPQEQNPETLTPEEQAYKEEAIKSLFVSYGSYDGYAHAIHKGKRSKLSLATIKEARVAFEATMTPATIRAEMAQIAEFTANPEENSPEAGFDTVFIPNTDLTATDETAMAKYLQDKIEAFASANGAYVDPVLHNDDTAHKATSNDVKVLAVRVPRHLNVRRSINTSKKAAVRFQADAVEAHNNNPDTAYKLEMADDLTAMAHIALLIDTNAIDTTTSYDEKRFWSTYYKNILVTPIEGYVANVCVDDYGRFARDRTYIDIGSPSRALVVPKA